MFYKKYFSFMETETKYRLDLKDFTLQEIELKSDEFATVVDSMRKEVFDLP